MDGEDLTLCWLPSVESLILLALPARQFSSEETRVGAIEIPKLRTLRSPGIFWPLLNTIVLNPENQISLTDLIFFIIPCTWLLLTDLPPRPVWKNLFFPLKMPG